MKHGSGVGLNSASMFLTYKLPEYQYISNFIGKKVGWNQNFPFLSKIKSYCVKSIAMIDFLPHHLIRKPLHLYVLYVCVCVCHRHLIFDQNKGTQNNDGIKLGSCSGQLIIIVKGIIAAFYTVLLHVRLLGWF